MKRKVINISGNCMMVSLPAKWVAKHNVKKGDEVEVEEKNNNLLIGSESVKNISSAEIELDLSDTKDIRDGKYYLTYRIIGNLYKKGVDSIKVKFSDIEALKYIREVCDKLIGFEIIEQEKNSCTIKNIAGPMDDDFETIKRKSFRLAIELSEEIFTAIKDGNLESGVQFREMLNTSSRYNDLTKRLINLSGGETSTFWYMILWEYEKITREFIYIYEQYAKIQKISDECLELFSKTIELVKGFYNALYEKDTHFIIKITNIKNELYWQTASNLFKKNESETTIIHHLATIVRKIYDLEGMYFAVTF